jgi:hypothetical protein
MKEIVLPRRHLCLDLGTSPLSLSYAKEAPKGSLMLLFVFLESECAKMRVRNFSLFALVISCIGSMKLKHSPCLLTGSLSTSFLVFSLVYMFPSCFAATRVLLTLFQLLCATSSSYSIHFFYALLTLCFLSASAPLFLEWRFSYGKPDYYSAFFFLLFHFVLAATSRLTSVTAELV